MISDCKLKSSTIVDKVDIIDKITNRGQKNTWEIHKESGILCSTRPLKYYVIRLDE